MTDRNRDGDGRSDGKIEQAVEIVEAGVGGKTIGTFDTEAEAEKYVEEWFGPSPAPTSGRVVWKGESRPGRSRYILKMRTALTDGGRVQDGDGTDGVIHQSVDADVLDATCGGRSIWFDENKERDDTLYVDNREEPAGFVDEAVANPPNNPNYAVEPDEVEDFRDLPYPAESFDLVIFDPPHIVRGDGMETLTGVLTKKYGSLHAETWQDDLRRGFLELFRVLRPGGTMVFKFCDESLDFETVTDLAPKPPLFGTTVRGGGSKIETRWFVFRKERDRDE